MKINKCQCACHENKLNKPYEHEKRCCDEMNGFVKPEEWEIEFDKRFEWGNEHPALLGKGDAKDFIRQKRREILDEIVEMINRLLKQETKKNIALENLLSLIRFRYKSLCGNKGNDEKEHTQNVETI